LNYSLQAYGKSARCTWIAEHLDAVLAQTLASRAYQALHRVCVGKARRVRFKSRRRVLSSIQNKRNDTGLRFVLQKPEEGNQGYLIWKQDQLPALIDWSDAVVKYGLEHRIKFARLVQRKASSPKAAGADPEGFCYFVQLALEGVPYHKPKHSVGSAIIGADLGPSTIALVPREGQASLSLFCEELNRDEEQLRRLQRKMERQRRAANPQNYDEKGRIKKAGKKQLQWKSSRRYQHTRCSKAAKERKLAAHRKSLSQEAALAAVSPVSVWRWPHSERPVLCFSGRLPRSSNSSPLVCPVPAVLGRCGGAPAGSTRASERTRECGAVPAPQLWHPQSRSASARKSA